MTKHIILTALAALALLASCSDGTDDSKPTPSVGKSGDISVTANDAVWTYYSLEQGKAVGTSAFGDGAADSDWRQRTDWDIAVCGDLLRTNSGSSGMGEGGLQVLDRAFPSVEEAPRSGYTVDDFQ